MPLVFIILWYGSLRLLFQNPSVCAQGSHISLMTTSTTCSPQGSSAAVFKRSILDILSKSDAEVPGLFFDIVRLREGLPASFSVTCSCLLRAKHASCSCSLPRSGFRKKLLTCSCTVLDRKLPWIVETPLGGCAGMMSIPRTLPLGDVLSTATYMRSDHGFWFSKKSDPFYLRPGSRCITLHIISRARAPHLLETHQVNHSLTLSKYPIFLVNLDTMINTQPMPKT